MQGWKTMSHINNGACSKCKEIMDRYPGLNQDLRNWFVMFQAKHHEAHVSCAGRGKADQEIAVRQHRSNAHWQHSAHNWNCALDLWVTGPNGEYTLPVEWFKEVLAPELPHFLNWYGAPGSPFYELPHVEIRAWHELTAIGKIHLVEDA